MTVLLRLLTLLALGYAGLCAVLYIGQDALLYHPTADTRAGAARELRLQVDGETLQVWRLGSGRDAILYFGGNGENVARTVPHLAGLFPDASVYLLSYRGYGGSTGEPGETELTGDARDLFDYARARHDSVSLIGRSLGSGVAAAVAATRPVRRLVLVTPYDSLEDLASDLYPFIPVSLLLRDKFRSVDRVQAIEAPTLILLAQHDSVVPRRNSMALAAAFPPGQVQVKTIAGATHNTIGSSILYLRAPCGIHSRWRAARCAHGPGRRTMRSRAVICAGMLLVSGLPAGCATSPDPAEPIEYSSSWFRCDSRFDCIAVYDAYCKYTAVNSRHALIYQDWARQEVTRVDELRPCPPSREDFPLAAACRAQTCEYP
ncbi:MAG: alpha/beta fold hydrolase [Woeseiaceae bacterium]|nr:alpha/beta fold hydrolase [Woeseiaceae bacterium]